MGKYLLDTNVIVEMLRGNQLIRNKIQSVGLENCVISEITIAELYFGAHKGGNPKNFKDIPFVENMFKRIPSYPAFDCFGKTLSFLKRNGISIDYFDVLIASTAIHNNLTIVTHNLKHFQRIPGLEIEDWQNGNK